MLFDLKKSLKKDRCKNDEELKKDLHGALFMQHYLIKKQLILDFDVNILERQCFPLNLILMNLNHLFKFSELRKIFKYLIFSDNEKNSNVSSYITETFNDY